MSTDNTSPAANEPTISWIRYILRKSDRGGDEGTELLQQAQLPNGQEVSYVLNHARENTATNYYEWLVDAQGNVTAPLEYKGPDAPHDGLISDAIAGGRRVDVRSATEGQHQQGNMLRPATIEVTRQAAGPIAARIIRILDQLAFYLDHSRRAHLLDEVEVRSDDLLDDLGYQRENDGHHLKSDRDYVRDRLRILERLEIQIGLADPAFPDEITILRAPLIDIRRASFIGPEDDHPLDTVPPRQFLLLGPLDRGLPSVLSIQLGWRVSDGDLWGP